MAVYSQSLVVYQYDHGSTPENTLTMAYGLARKGADGFNVQGTGLLANVQLTIPRKGPATSAETWGSKGQWSEVDVNSAFAREQRAIVAKLFVRGNTVTVSSSDYTVYAHASYMIERGRPRWAWYGLFADPAYPYPNEVYTPPP